jgi:hypothetical protein
MVLRNNLQTLKMWETENVVKQIQSFQSLLEQLSTIGATSTNDDVVLSLMRYICLSSKTFIISMQKQPNIIISYHWVFKKEVLMKN